MRVGGDDANSGNEGRRERNLNFRSNIYELKLQFEYYLVEEPEGIYNFAGYQYNGPFCFDYSLYLFGGIAPFNITLKLLFKERATHFEIYQPKGKDYREALTRTAQ